MLRDVLTKRLIADFDFKQTETPKGVQLRDGRCSVCGHDKARTPPNGPWVVLCGREKNCGAKRTWRQLYPDLQLEVGKHHPATKADPNATARATAILRGIPEDIVASLIPTWFRQGERIIDGKAYPTLRFELPNGSANHRLIDYAGKDKTRAEGPFSGYAWEPPNFKPGASVWIVEACLCAISLNIQGIPAVASISAPHVPRDWLKKASELRWAVVIASDNDAAGKKAARAIAECCHDLGVNYQFAFAPEEQDWNDLLMQGALTEGARSEAIKDAEWRGRLFSAPDAAGYWGVWKERRPHDWCFEFHGETYIARDEGPVR
ncbi:MAG TPA: toprim domain-containing protein, partial [bacterium]